MSVGAIVGIVAGGLFGFVALLVIVSYIMRWWKRHSAERDFVDEYNDFSPTSGNPSRGGDDVFGGQMSQHGSSPSIGGSAGMAGHGVMASRAGMRGPGYNGGYSGYPHVDDETISGAYSSQPQPQASYNPEVYGAYTPYNGGAGYQEAMRGYQGQRSFEAPVNVGYAISEAPIPQAAGPVPITSSPPAPAPSTSPGPARSTSPPRTTAAAALAAAQAAAAAPVHAQERKSAVYNEEDAYGGF
ncbi:hypothetical protein AX15_001024 [Amanita polypyramis BW_CC]|nr:hypothetical protein AX15_001024 [Amanita polypyramis BW_CC]